MRWYDDGLVPKRWVEEAGALQLLPDTEFKAAEQTTKEIRERMTAAWLRQEDAKRTQPLSSTMKTSSKCPPMCDCVSQLVDRHQEISTKGEPGARSRINVFGVLKRSTANNITHSSLLDRTPITANVAEEKVEPLDLAAESSTKTCDQCKKIKKPPRGKKIAWRQRTGKYMYVHKDAPDKE